MDYELQHKILIYLDTIDKKLNIIDNNLNKIEAKLDNLDNKIINLEYCVDKLFSLVSEKVCIFV